MLSCGEIFDFCLLNGVSVQCKLEWFVEGNMLILVTFCHIEMRQNSVNAQSAGQGAGSGQNAASGGQGGGANLQLSNAGMVAGSYIHGGKSKGAALNMSSQNPQGSMNSMRLRNLKGGK